MGIVNCVFTNEILLNQLCVIVERKKQTIPYIIKFCPRKRIVGDYIESFKLSIRSKQYEINLHLML